MVAVWPGASASNSATGIQSTLSAATSNESAVIPHHPITCQGNLYFEEDGSMGCDHAKVPPDEPRNKAIQVHSIAMLIIELAATTL